MHSKFRLHKGIFFLPLMMLIALSISFNQAALQVAAQQPTGIICAISPDEVAGQGGLTVGSLGLTVGSLGLTVGSLGLTPGSLALTPGSLALTPGSLGLTPGSLGENSDEALTQLLEEIALNPADENWLREFIDVIGSGPGYNTSAVAVLIVDDFEDSPTAVREHGEAVTEVFEQVISAAGLSNVRVVPVDATAGADYVVDGPNGIAERIRSTVTQLRNEGYERFVVNMSFGLIPCDDQVQVDGETIEWNINEYTSAREESFESRPIQLIFECVVRNRDNTYTAHFGYVNPNDYPVIVPYNSSTNKLTGGGLNNDQLRARTPTYFGVPSDNPDRANGTQFYPNSGFQINFRNGTLNWHFQGQRFQVNSRHALNCNATFRPPSGPAATADSYAPQTFHHNPPRYSPLRPILECVEFDSSRNRYIAHFGYKNENNFLVTVLHGHSNKLTGGGLNSNQLSNRTPTLFALPQVVPDQPGRSQYYPNPFFSVEFNGSNLVWTLKGPDGSTRTATASSNPAQRCPEIQRYNDYSLSDYFGSEWTQILPQLLNNPVVDDPNLNALIPLFQGYLNESAAYSNFALIPFAASGNTRPIFVVNGFAEPLSPARLPQVISVGSTLGQSEPNAPFASYSHDASILTPGAWYDFGNNVYGAGTSYSTPAAAAFATVFLSYSDPDVCNFGEEGAGRVPLRQAGFINARFNSLNNYWPLDCEVPEPNQPPTAGDDTVSTTYRAAAFINVLNNDTDLDEDYLSILSIGTPEYGTAQQSEDQIMYVPGDNFPEVGQLGYDSFTYTITDGQDTATATIYVTVARLQLTSECPRGSFRVTNPAPFGISFGWDVYDTSVAGSGYVEANSTATFNTGVPVGTVRLFVGETQHDVKATINNCAPTANNDTVTVDAGSSVTVNVLANDSDPDNNTLFVDSVSDPESGTVIINADFSVTYTPDSGFTGTDTFTYTITDAQDPNTGKSGAVVTVTVNAVFSTAVCRTAGAMYVVEGGYIPGVSNRDNQPVQANRQVLSNVLGVPQYNDNSSAGINFVSLGFDNLSTELREGVITLDFGQAIFPNPTGYDFTVAETSWGNPSFNSYPEQAVIFVSQDIYAEYGGWIEVGTAQLDTSFELPEGLDWIRYVMVMDASNRSRFSRSNTSDGYDLDGVGACVVGPLPEEPGGETAALPEVNTMAIINQPPTVEAGMDILLTDANNDGFEPVALNALASDLDGTITTYAWSADTGLWIDAAASPVVNVPVGTHYITLLVIDDGGLSATDTLVITVNQPPFASAGVDLVVVDADSSGTEAVTLTAAAQDFDGTIVSYAWSSDTGLLAGPMAEAAATFELPVGVHVFTLIVTDNLGATAAAIVTVTVNPVVSQ